METEVYFEQKLKSLDIEYNQGIKEKFDIYYNFLIDYNKNVNLTAITEKDEVYEKHFIDSILPAKKFENNAKICDIGTGAGFPAFPLAIINKSLNIYAVDSLNKRIDFLNLLKQKINLDNVQNFHSRAEDFAKTHRK